MNSNTLSEQSHKASGASGLCSAVIINIASGTWPFDLICFFVFNFYLLQSIWSHLCILCIIYITILLVCVFALSIFLFCLFSYLSPRSLLLCLHFPLSITVFLLSAVLSSPIWQPCEQGRKLRRIHWVANVGRALKFLEGRRVRKSIPRVLCSGVQLQVITTQSDLHNLFPTLILLSCFTTLSHERQREGKPCSPFQV